MAYTYEYPHPAVSVDVAVHIRECAELLRDKGIRHLPVMSGKDVVGLISIGDLVQAIISDQQEEIEQLENYISG